MGNQQSESNRHDEEESRRYAEDVVQANHLYTQLQVLFDTIIQCDSLEETLPYILEHNDLYDGLQNIQLNKNGTYAYSLDALERRNGELRALVSLYHMMLELDQIMNRGVRSMLDAMEILNASSKQLQNVRVHITQHALGEYRCVRAELGPREQVFTTLKRQVDDALSRITLNPYAAAPAQAAPAQTRVPRLGVRSHGSVKRQVMQMDADDDDDYDDL